jgi:hypothetical protein
MEGHGTIRLEWEPQPHVVFSFDIPPQIDFRWTMESMSEAFEVKLDIIGDRFGSGSAHASGLTTRMMSGVFDRTLHGYVDDEFETGDPAATDSVVFHVPNFPRFTGTPVSMGAGSFNAGRLTTRTNGWVIEIDAVPHHLDLQKKLNANGGYVIGHVGRIQRVDGNPVRYESMREIGLVLRKWFSLLRSQRTEPILVCGIHEGRVVWERWRSPSVDPWIGRRGWLPSILLQQAGPNALADFGPVVQGLLEMGHGSDLERVISHAIDWYTQSVTTVHVETRVILAQAGLEIMSWLRLVTEIGMSESTFTNMPASDALRLALDHASVSAVIPSTLPALHSAARPQQGGAGQLDGPGAIVEIRNGTLHPKPNLRLGSDLVMVEGGLLALRYLEMMLLHRLGFMGAVLNGVNHWETELVPWR